MTTTADKRIKELEARIGGIQLDLESLKRIVASQSEPPDPEPLECWGNDYGDGEPGCHQTKSIAEEVALPGVKRIAVHMREVTPQMRQDEKDAARYRCLRDHFSVNGVINLARCGPSQWDERIDEAIQGKG